MSTVTTNTFLSSAGNKMSQLFEDKTYNFENIKEFCSLTKAFEFQKNSIKDSKEKQNFKQVKRTNLEKINF